MKKKIIAVILCGGIGSRISSLTKKTPKSLLKVLNKPIIWYVVNSLLKNKITNIIFPLGYKGNLIEHYIKKNFKTEKDNFKFIDTGVKTEINDRIKKIIKYLKNYDEIILLNSDTIFDFDLKSFLNYHTRKNNLISLSGIKMFTSWGNIIIDRNNLLKKFNVNAQISSYRLKNYDKYEAFRNTGISIINNKSLSFVKTIKNKNFEISLYNKYIKYKKVGVLVFKGFWYPIETYKDLKITKSDKKIFEKISKLKKKLSSKVK